MIGISRLPGDGRAEVLFNNGGFHSADDSIAPDGCAKFRRLSGRLKKLKPSNAAAFMKRFKVCVAANNCSALADDHNRHSSDKLHCDTRSSLAIYSAALVTADPAAAEAAKSHFTTVRLRGVTSNRDGIGARQRSIGAQH